MTTIRTVYTRAQYGHFVYSNRRPSRVRRFQIYLFSIICFLRNCIAYSKTRCYYIQNNIRDPRGSTLQLLSCRPAPPVSYVFNKQRALLPVGCSINTKTRGVNLSRVYYTRYQIEISAVETVRFPTEICFGSATVSRYQVRFTAGNAHTYVVCRRRDGRAHINGQAYTGITSAAATRLQVFFSRVCPARVLLRGDTASRDPQQ